MVLIRSPRSLKLYIFGLVFEIFKIQRCTAIFIIKMSACRPQIFVFLVITTTEMITCLMPLSVNQRCRVFSVSCKYDI